MVECQKCKKVLTKKGSHFICQGPCQGTFHRGCVKGLAADMKAGKSRIFCNNCEEDDSESENEEEVVMDQDKILKDIQKKVNAISGLRKQLDTIKESMSLLSDNYDKLLAVQEQSNEKIVKMEKSVSTLSNKCIYLEKCNGALEQRVMDLEQAARKDNLEIAGVEQLPGENPIEVVKKISNMLKVDMDDADISCARRLPQRNQDKPAPIIVSFTPAGSGKRNSLLAQRRNLINLNSQSITSGTLKNKIFINEDLTKPLRELLWKTKTQLRGSFKYIWISNGKILVKKGDSDKDKSTWVRSESILYELKSEVK